MQAFHNDKKIKEKYLKRVQDHAAADEIIQGTYWEKGKGCAVGCTVETSDSPHQAMEDQLGIPRILCYLEDSLFEELTNGEAKKFPLRFLEAIPVGADLSRVYPKLVIWEWEDPEYGLRNLDAIKEDKELLEVGDELVVLYKRELANEKISSQEWDEIFERAEKLYSASARASASAWARASARASASAWARASASAWARARASASASASAWAWARASYMEEYNKQINVTVDKLIELLKDA